MQPHLSRDKSKSPHRALAGRLSAEAGLNPAQIRVSLEAVSDHIATFHDEFRDPGVIVWTAVSIREPAGKPLRDCEVVGVQLTYLHESDIEVQREQGTVEMRATRLYRMCREARNQGGLLSYEDLSLLLCVDVSTVRDLVRRLRAQGFFVPTRGAVKDIGPEPSHKKLIAGLLGRGYSTSKIGSMTSHSEGAIGRYQVAFGLVLYLLHTYPDAPEGELRLLSGLGPKAWAAYVEVARELADDPACQPHLARLRRRYEMDPEGIACKVPPGKMPQSDPERRLREQSLTTAIRQTVQEDLDVTRRVADAVTEDLIRLIDETFLVTDRVRPGEVVVFADRHDAAFISGERVADRPVMQVRVPLYTPEVKEIWRSDEPVGRRRARIAAQIATAAAEQGAVMTVAGLAELLHVRPSTMGRDLRELAVEVHVEAPTKGLIEDAGPTLTHKDWIVDLDQHGLTGEEISWLTRHAPASRDRYIEMYRRAEALMRLEGTIPDALVLARTLRLRRHVAQQYVDLLERFHGDGEAEEANADIPF